MVVRIEDHVYRKTDGRTWTNDDPKKTRQATKWDSTIHRKPWTIYSHRKQKVLHVEKDQDKNPPTCDEKKAIPPPTIERNGSSSGSELEIDEDGSAHSLNDESSLVESSSESEDVDADHASLSGDSMSSAEEVMPETSSDINDDSTRSDDGNCQTATTFLQMRMRTTKIPRTMAATVRAKHPPTTLSSSIKSHTSAWLPRRATKRSQTNHQMRTTKKRRPKGVTSLAVDLDLAPNIISRLGFTAISAAGTLFLSVLDMMVWRKTCFTSAFHVLPPSVTISALRASEKEPGVRTRAICFPNVL
jgi:hypothetical protein